MAGVSWHYINGVQAQINYLVKMLKEFNDYYDAERMRLRDVLKRSVQSIYYGGGFNSSDLSLNVAHNSSYFSMVQAFYDKLQEYMDIIIPKMAELVYLDPDLYPATITTITTPKRSLYPASKDLLVSAALNELKAVHDVFSLSYDGRYINSGIPVSDVIKNSFLYFYDTVFKKVWGGEPGPVLTPGFGITQQTAIKAYVRFVVQIQPTTKTIDFTPYVGPDETNGGLSPTKPTELSFGPFTGLGDFSPGRYVYVELLNLEARTISDTQGENEINIASKITEKIVGRGFEINQVQVFDNNIVSFSIAVPDFSLEKWIGEATYNQTDLYAYTVPAVLPYDGFSLLFISSD